MKVSILANTYEDLPGDSARIQVQCLPMNGGPSFQRWVTDRRADVQTYWDGGINLREFLRRCDSSGFIVV